MTYRQTDIRPFFSLFGSTTAALIHFSRCTSELHKGLQTLLFHIIKRTDRERKRDDFATKLERDDDTNERVV